VDEAHNLVERSRSMYSASVCKEDFLNVRRIVKPYSRSLDKLLEKCNRILLEHKRQCENYRIYEDIGNLLFSLMQLASKMDEFLQKPMEFAGRKDVLDFYFELRNFLNIYELTDERYVIYSEFTEDGAFVIRLFCVDPSENLQKCLDKARSTIFFSATLLPIHYYKRLLSTEEDNYAIYAESPFSQEKRLLAIGGDVSTKYTRRTPEEFARIAQYILKTIRCKAGNYMVFFPSYKMMNDVHNSFCEMADPSIFCMLQKNNMDEKAREAFLREFEAPGERTLVAFCVMGGIFGEGIDLKHDRLIGAIVVGTGLPQISNEREILKNYYDEQSGNGFDYAFRYPGINKVLQAAGRVIRTDEDRGVILLLDERFRQRDYAGLYPREWEKRSFCTLDTVEDVVRGFWEQ
jgi:Rad3-related DNA helicase